LTLRPARLLAPLRRIEPGLPGPRRLLLPGFRQFGHPPCRWVSLQHGLDSLCWRDLHPLEWQLASLHQTHAMLSSRFSMIIGIRSNMSSAGAATADAVSTEQFATPPSY